MRLPEMLDRSTEDQLRASHHLKGAIVNLRNGMAGQPGAQHFDEDRTSGHTSRTYCEDCGEDPPKCECDEPAIITVPAISDPTGDTAIEKDTVALTHKRLARAIRTIERETRVLTGIVDVWRDKTEEELRQLDRGEKLELESSNEAKCEIHLRYGHERKAKALSTRVRHQGRHLLEDHHRLCDWCIETVKRLERLPTQVEVDNNMSGKQLRVVVDDPRPGWQRRLNPDAASA